MTGPTYFLQIVPDALEAHAAEAELSGNATGLYRYLRDNADRHEGLYYGGKADMAEGSRYGRKTVARLLAELVGADLVEDHTRQGHDGYVVLLRHAELIYQPEEARSRQMALRSRQTTRRSRQMTRRSRQTTQGSRQVTRANRDDVTDRERDTDSLSGLRRTGPEAGPGSGRTVAELVGQYGRIHLLQNAVTDVDNPERLDCDEAGNDFPTPRRDALDVELERLGWSPYGGAIAPEGVELVADLCDALDDWLGGRGARPAWLPDVEETGPGTDSGEAA